MAQRGIQLKINVFFAYFRPGFDPYSVRQNSSDEDQALGEFAESVRRIVLTSMTSVQHMSNHFHTAYPGRTKKITQITPQGVLAGMPWHGMDPWTRIFMAWHGTENLGTEILGTALHGKYWHAKNMAQHGTEIIP